MDNYLAAETLLIARLKRKVSLVASGDIQPVSDAGKEASQNVQRSKLISVQLLDDQPVTSQSGHANDGRFQAYRQSWLIVLRLRNVSDSSGYNARKQAGPIVTEIKKALQGHELSHDFDPLIAAKSPYRPGFYKGVYSHPFVFETQIAVMAED